MLFLVEAYSYIKFKNCLLACHLSMYKSCSCSSCFFMLEGEEAILSFLANTAFKPFLLQKNKTNDCLFEKQ